MSGDTTMKNSFIEIRLFPALDQSGADEANDKSGRSLNRSAQSNSTQSDQSIDRSTTLGALEPNSASETELFYFEIDVLEADSLPVADASSTENLFGLENAVSLTDTQPDFTPFSATDSLGATVGQAQTLANIYLAKLYNDPIEWGRPLIDQQYWRLQSGSASCAIVAQISIYQSLTGRYIGEQAACNYAQARGWFNPRTGTSPLYVGKLLNAYNISTTQKYNATLNDLAVALSRGDKPIVGLDGNEIWRPQRDRYGNPVEQANAGHAVWVTGIDREANGSWNIILNDSGTPTGRASVIDYRDFLNAWKDYGSFLTVADNPLT
jgi:hypothetical protein